MVAAAIVCFCVYLLLAPKQVTSPPQPSENPPATEDTTDPEPEPTKPALINVQPIIDTWEQSQSGRYSIVVYDLANNEIIGEKHADDVYFAASIYKLYVAYEGYLAAERGVYNLNEPYLNGQTRKQCLDKMIRESDSPCGEKLWAELGKVELTDTLRSYGLTHTSMTNLTTTAHDAATLLIRLLQNDELEQHKNLLLASMKDQIYRDALANGFAGATFYNKVGFRDFDEYHDVGILELQDGRQYVVSMLTDSIGTAAMANLGSQLLTALSAEAVHE